MRVILLTALVAAGGAVTATWLYAQTPPAATASSAKAAAPAGKAAAARTPQNLTPQKLFETYCVDCHFHEAPAGGLALDTLDLSKPGANAEKIEAVIGKLRAGSMPPPGNDRPDPATYRRIAGELETMVDAAWVLHPNPGRIGAVQRLNRTEYNHAIRDLLKLDVDVKPLLPGDDTADGSFDNFADSLSISTDHLERYMSVARQVTRLAVGLPPAKPGTDKFEVPLHVLQRDRMSEDLPFGSRGGIAVHYNFPTDGEYTIHVRLQRQYQDYLKGMGWPQQLEIRLDGKLLKRFTVGGAAKGRAAAASYAGDGEPGFAGDPSWETYMQLTGDAGLDVRVPVKAGERVVGVSFVREEFEPEGLPQPQQLGRVISNDQVYMDYANVATVEIGGPYQAPGPAKDTPSRRAIFVCYPKAQAEERSCAATILAHMARLAYRRPTTKQDVDTLLQFFDQGRQDGGSFDSGVQFALERMIVDPDFLLRVYRDTAEDKTSPAARIHPLTDLELASRLSFFLWSSIPDDHLLTLAEHHELNKPEVLEKEVRRMLADPRAIDSLVDDFSAQWLNLRRVDEVVVDPQKYPMYDDSLLNAYQTETKMFVTSTIQEDRNVDDLLDANYTFVNERLAQEYGIPGVYGSRFRRVTLPNHDQRGGLLAQGSILVTTSYPDRTSPVLRGKWLLNNIFGLPIPPPPPGVNTTLESKPGQRPAAIRDRLAQHRTSPTCNSCHSVIDPLGFTLENYDVIGGWRTIDESGKAVDASGTTASGEKVAGLDGLRRLLLEQPDQFPKTVTEKLMAYALGRRLEYYDEPSVRAIVRKAAKNDYRWSAIVSGIVESPAFLERETGAAEAATVAQAK